MKREIIDPYEIGTAAEEFFKEKANQGSGYTIQFEEMSDYERDEIEQALLKYCELDTMAMVMIYEGWKDLRISTSKKQVNASAKNSSFG